MKQVAAAIYISFGLLFVFLQGIEGYVGADHMNFIIFLFFFVGGLYLYQDLKDFIKEKKSKD